MKTDRIERVINTVAVLMEEYLRANDDATSRDRDTALEPLNRLFGTLFHAYCNLERLPAEIELLEANTEKAREELAIGKVAASSVKELVREMFNDD